MNFEEVKRVLITPYWCRGNPLRWQDGKAGIAYFAEQGKVGTFNLSWWAMGQPPHPVPAAAYVNNLGIRWAVTYAPSVMAYGKSLIDHACIMKLHDFNTMILRIMDTQQCVAPNQRVDIGLPETLVRALARKPSVGA